MCTRELVLGVAVLALSLSAARAETDHAKLVVQVRSEVPDKWHVMYDEKQTAYVATSPIYALEYKEGCVMYRQAFPVINGNVSFARMDFYKLYFAGAAGDECFGISQSRFFAMEEGAEPYSTLDFIRHVYNGPESSRDRVKPVELPRLEACFASQARKGGDVTYATSKPQEDSAALAYAVTMKCPVLNSTERIFASSEDGQTIAWDIRISELIDVQTYPPH